MLINIVIARGTAEENNTRNFGNSIRSMMPTSGELHIALMNNFIKIHFQSKYIETTYELCSTIWLFNMLNSFKIQAPPECMSNPSRWYLTLGFLWMHEWISMTISSYFFWSLLWPLKSLLHLSHYSSQYST